MCRQKTIMPASIASDIRLQSILRTCTIQLSCVLSNRRLGLMNSRNREKISQGYADSSPSTFVLCAEATCFFFLKSDPATNITNLLTSEEKQDKAAKSPCEKNNTVSPLKWMQFYINTGITYGKNKIQKL